MFNASLTRTFAAAVIASVALVGCAAADMQPKAAEPHMLAQNASPLTTSAFKGAKVNGGYATLSHQDGKIVLTLSDDFKTPDTPAPHWQVVDSKGNTYLLNRLQIKGDKFNKTVTLPSYINDVQKVQIWCAFAEVLLGEATFASPVM